MNDRNANGTIPYEDFGGRGSLLHFAHANAYPPATYRALLSTLARRHRVLAVHHRPLWPGSRPQELDSWSDIAADLIRFFDQHKLRDVIGVGHSLGAVVTMMASLQRPELFRALVLIEPVFLPKIVLDLLAAGAALDGPYEMPLVKIARKRRYRWPSQEDAYRHLRPKSIFSRLSDTALWDYVRYGMIDDPDGGVRLFYSSDWEARIYATPPTGIWDLIPEIAHPTLGMRGRMTDTLTGQSWALWQELQPSATFEEFEEAGHLLPFELPGDVAARIEHYVGLL